MKASTGAERTRKWRESKKSAGLVRVEFMLKPDQAAKVRAYVGRLK